MSTRDVNFAVDQFNESSQFQNYPFILESPDCEKKVKKNKKVKQRFTTCDVRNILEEPDANKDLFQKSIQNMVGQNVKVHNKSYQTESR